MMLLIGEGSGNIPIALFLAGSGVEVLSDLLSSLITVDGDGNFLVEDDVFSCGLLSIELSPSNKWGDSAINL